MNRSQNTFYKIYSALITQTSTNAPVVIELNNTIGPIVWTRFTTGTYRGTLTGAFTQNKTIGIVNELGNLSAISGVRVNAMRSSDNIFQIRTGEAGTLFDGLMNGMYLEIRVYR